VANPWFESVAEARRQARTRLPAGVYASLLAGSEQGLTPADNVAAFGELGFAPHTAGLPNDRGLSTTVLGERTSMPC
jgi:isopentenyl diphosphate isomerase/L-lactate dehydrogenase-like FMN-dependent dehydrogenase